MSNKATLENAMANLKRSGATDFSKEMHGKHLISFSCVENDGRRYAYFSDGERIARHRDITDEMIAFLK